MVAIEVETLSKLMQSWDMPFGLSVGHDTSMVVSPKSIDRMIWADGVTTSDDGKKEKMKNKWIPIRNVDIKFNRMSFPIHFTKRIEFVTNDTIRAIKIANAIID